MKVSVITITYNRSHLIGDTIRSVLNQTYANFEHVIIDDGSTDDTEQLVKNFADPRIIYRKFDKIGNLSKLHNLGINASSGDLIAVLDSDDIWVAHKLESVVTVFRTNPEVCFLTHNIRYFSNLNNLEKPYYSFKIDFYKHALDDVLQFKILPFPVIAFRKNLIKEIGSLDESIIDGQQDFLIRAASKHKVYCLAECLTYMRIHGQNIHKANNLPYFINYYKTITKLLLRSEIGFLQFSNGIIINSKSLIKHTLKTRLS